MSLSKTLGANLITVLATNQLSTKKSYKGVLADMPGPPPKLFPTSIYNIDLDKPDNLSNEELSHHKHDLAVSMGLEYQEAKRVLEKDFEDMKKKYREEVSDVHQIAFLFNKIKDYLDPVMYDSIIELEEYLDRYKEKE